MQWRESVNELAQKKQDYGQWDLAVVAGAARRAGYGEYVRVITSVPENVPRASVFCPGGTRP
jgi:hypothetical protein